MAACERFAIEPGFTDPTEEHAEAKESKAARSVWFFIRCP
jgi:hypothetical protein